MTDEDANNMTHKDGSIKPSYNHQSARDGKYGIVTADTKHRKILKQKVENII